VSCVGLVAALVQHQQALQVERDGGAPRTSADAEFGDRRVGSDVDHAHRVVELVDRVQIAAIAIDDHVLRFPSDVDGLNR